ncbi:MAG: GNAT family N-acetyltransferase [Streptosporangiales bacterium]|nr:GNAT family N-acetyltransferase [Streptosporangiales bacterium]
MQLRTGSGADAAGVAALHTHSWQTAYAGIMPGSFLTGPQSDGRVLVDNLHAHPDRRRSGIGRQLVGQVFAWTAANHPDKPVYLQVLDDNAPAVAFYERCGGEVTDRLVEQFSAGFELPALEYTWRPAAVRAAASPVSPTAR